MIGNAFQDDRTRRAVEIDSRKLLTEAWDEMGKCELVDIEPIHVRAYLDHRAKDLGRIASARTHYSAIKGLFQYLVEKSFLRATRRHRYRIHS